MEKETVDTPAMLEEVVEGLQKKEQKTLPSKFFYDKRGSKLFEKICLLDEYYLTRTELSIMSENIQAIANQAGKNVQLIELGSGSSRKTRLLLDHLEDIHSYVPVDISDEFLKDIARNLNEEYSDLSIIPIATDYTKPFSLPKVSENTQRIIYYPGSTIGNFTKKEAADFIKLIRDLVGENGGLLIGFDLLKDEQILLSAYDDSKGVTAAFNKNILHRINHELDGNFEVDLFEHLVIFNQSKNRIEMHLQSTVEQLVEVAGHHINFDAGETIHTENSHKYSLNSFGELTQPYFSPVQTWTDPNQKFAIQFLK